MNNFQFQQTDIFCVSGKFFVWKKKHCKRHCKEQKSYFKKIMGGNIFALRFSACIYILIRVRPWNFTKCNSLVVSYRDCMLILFRYVNCTYLFSDGSDARNPSFMFLLVFGSSKLLYRVRVQSSTRKYVNFIYTQTISEQNTWYFKILPQYFCIYSCTYHL